MKQAQKWRFLAGKLTILGGKSTHLSWLKRLQKSSLSLQVENHWRYHLSVCVQNYKSLSQPLEHHWGKTKRSVASSTSCHLWIDKLLSKEPKVKTNMVIKNQYQRMINYTHWIPNHGGINPSYQSIEGSPGLIS